jgi:beta-N-acetylhexosaminidase
MRAMGIDAPFAPVADVCDHPQNPVIGTRAFGGVASHVARHVAAAIGGYREGGVASCAKHFPGHGHTDVDSHHALPVVNHDQSRLDSVDLVPFVGAIKAGVDMVMVSHLLVKAIDGALPASSSRAVVTGLLRERLGFQGVIVTDALDMRAITDAYGLAEAAVLAVGAGCDLVAFNAPVESARDVHGAITAAIMSGRLTEANVRESGARVQSLRQSLARHRRPPLSTVGDPTHQAVADEVAQLALTAIGEATPLITQVPGQTTVIEFDPRLPFTDLNVHAPPTRLAEEISARLAGTVAHVIAPATWSSHEASIIGEARGAKRVIVATRSAWRDDHQRRALRAIAAVAPDLTVVCLRDPQDATIMRDVRNVVTYADDPSSIRAVTAWLVDGAPAPGTMPVALS